MGIRKAVWEDLSQILSIYESARAFMVQTGNPRQWAVRNWPPRHLVEQDINRGKSYVCEDEGTILAVFFYDYGENIEPSYGEIDGHWIGKSAYGVIHRIAARPGKGAGRQCIEWAYRQCGHLRIDTHGDNRVMQNILRQLGFTYCGVIRIQEDNDPRLAYEKI